MYNRLKVLKSTGKKITYPLPLVMIYIFLENYFSFPKWIESLVHLYIFIFIGYLIISFYIVLYLRIKYILSKNTLVLHKKDKQIFSKLIMLFCGICFSTYGIYLLYDFPFALSNKIEWINYFIQFVFSFIILFGVIVVANAIFYFDDLLIFENEIIYLDSEKDILFKIKNIERVEIRKIEQEKVLSIYDKEGAKTDILESFEIKKSTQKRFWERVGIKLKTD